MTVNILKRNEDKIRTVLALIAITTTKNVFKLDAVITTADQRRCAGVLCTSFDFVLCRSKRAKQIEAKNSN